MRRSGLRAVVALSAAALAISACAGSPVERPDRIVLADGQELGGYNPVAGYGELGVSPIYEGLLRPQANTDDRLPDLVPSLATSGPAQVGPRQWRLPLRAGVRFSDGSTLDSSDVVTTYAAVRNPVVASEISTNFTPIVDIRADGPGAVVVTMNTDADPSPYLLLGIAPSEKIEDAPVADWALNTAPVGTGPYELESLRPDQAVMAAREDYWGEAPEVTSLVFTYTPDDNTRAQRIATGEVDGTSLPPKMLAAVANRDGVETVGVQSADWRGVSFPAQNPFTADPRARLAMNLGIDREAVITDVLDGHGRAAGTPVAAVYGDAYDPDAEFAFDATGAESVLDAAGWVTGPAGIRERDGREASFELLYNAQDTLRRDLAVAFAAAMEPLGIEVTPRGSSWDEIETLLDTSAVVLGGGATPYSIDSQVYDTLHTRVPNSSPYSNPGDFAPPGMDALLQQARESAPSPENDARYRDIQSLYKTAPSYVFLVFLDHTYAYRDLGWQQSPPILEPHSHGVAWGPWWHTAAWTR
ncbi:ABC transporter substrate-binding protein [Gordonia rubripertincta]|uniref:ABC transporter substrate-binding protein n=1 Tax=Gordonia rubripertincta TaxID=36822 RepID=A0ABT4MXK0_GORRU|nr:ABC transporter substrate-binding protein [Gordonia rubripertincta]MCZ4551544.1 ABC transporter substrate-binding protein [Gordonia rubripertincta]